MASARKYRIPTTHTGSLPRPAEIRQGSGIQPDALRQAVAAVVDRQVQAGVNIIGDGETSKPNYATYVSERLTGFGDVSGPVQAAEAEQFPELIMQLFTDPEVIKALSVPACVGPVQYRGHPQVQRDIANLLAASQSADVTGVFMSAASPGVIALFHENRHYRSHEEYLGALADAMKEEYDAIHQAGLILQLDCPDLATNVWRDRPYADAGEFRRHMAVNIEALNYATRDIPAEAMRLHACWGNFSSTHVCDLPLSDLIDVLLTARPAALSFEAANPRHAHEWTLFENLDLPDGKIIIPGIIDPTTNYVEHPELVAQRIRAYARLVGPERLIAGTDCGFATLGFPIVDPKVAWAKLASLAEGARIVNTP